MKNRFTAVVIVALITFTAIGQALRKTERIHSNQVPVAIQEAFKKDFGTVPTDGYWTASFVVEREGNRSVAKPLSYTFHKKDKSEKIEVRYTADAKLDLVKGLEKLDSSNS